jgi:hypothetical protein
MKPILGYPHYFITKAGKIWTKARPRVRGGWLKPFEKDGYRKVKHGTRNFKRACGVENGGAKLTPFLVRMIRDWYATGLVLQKELAALFEVHKETIGKIVRKKAWK